MMEIKELRSALRLAARRNPAAYKIIGMVTGYPEKRIREIAEGKGAEPTMPEIIVLSAHAQGD